MWSTSPAADTKSTTTVRMAKNKQQVRHVPTFLQPSIKDCGGHLHTKDGIPRKIAV